MIQFGTQRNAHTTLAAHRQRLVALAKQRAAEGWAPPAEIYRVELRREIDWSEFPAWARPVDPEVFDRCCHEG
jgi:hypothetical protein